MEQQQANDSGIASETVLPVQPAFSESEAAISVKVRPKPRPRKAPGKVDRLPQWKILLHNDDVNEIGYVVETIVELVALNPMEALIHTLEAHKSGLALLMMTHQERAELLAEQFMSKRLTVTIEPDR